MFQARGTFRKRKIKLKNAVAQQIDSGGKEWRFVANENTPILWNGFYSFNFLASTPAEGTEAKVSFCYDTYDPSQPVQNKPPPPSYGLGNKRTLTKFKCYFKHEHMEISRGTEVSLICYKLNHCLKMSYVKYHKYFNLKCQPLHQVKHQKQLKLPRLSLLEHRKLLVHQRHDHQKLQKLLVHLK